VDRLTGPLVVIALSLFDHVVGACGRADDDGHASIGFEGDAPPPDSPLDLWYRRPASAGSRRCPSGTAGLGAMIFGGIHGERLQLNEDSLWSGSYQDADNPRPPPRCRRSGGFCSSGSTSRRSSSRSAC
jgi:hypothetical protein